MVSQALDWNGDVTDASDSNDDNCTDLPDPEPGDEDIPCLADFSLELAEYLGQLAPIEGGAQYSGVVSA
jgi:hypothetical protein